MAQLTANGIPFVTDFMNGGHESYVWRKNLHDYLRTVAFRQTSTAVSVEGASVTATVTPGTTEPTAPTGAVQFSAGGVPLGAPVALSSGKATLAVPSTAEATSITATYSGDRFYNASTGTAAYESSSSTGTVGGTVPATLALTLGTPAAFGAFTPGLTKDYTATQSVSVTSTASDATLTVSDPSSTSPGHLVNGTFSLANPLLAAGAALPATVHTWDAPTTNESVTVPLTQHIGADEPLRTGSYSKTLTYTLSTTTP
jgi:hypothetical protein